MFIWSNCKTIRIHHEIELASLRHTSLSKTIEKEAIEIYSYSSHGNSIIVL